MSSYLDIFLKNKERVVIMFEISLKFMSQLCDLIVPFISLYFSFDVIGSLLFNKR